MNHQQNQPKLLLQQRQQISDENITLLQKDQHKQQQAANFKRNRSSLLLKDTSLKYCSKDQWWQLFDTKTRKFFYYNAYEQKTTWHKPNILNDTLESINKEEHDLESKNLNEKENQLVKNPVVIPLASKLIERINTNLILVRKSKKFLKSVRKKLDCDLKYDPNDLNIISTLTERLLNIQNILTEDDDTTNSFYDFSRLEMSSFMRLNKSSANESDQSTSHLHSPLSSSYSFRSSQSLESSFSILQQQQQQQQQSNNRLNSSQKRRLAPRTNPNYVNVDFVNSKNGTLIKNTYVRLQDLTNENDLDSNSNNNNNNATTSVASNQTLSQSILILLSLLSSNTKKKQLLTNEIESKQFIQELKQQQQQQKSNLINYSSSSSSMNTICSLNMKLKNLKQNQHEQPYSLCSSSATLISESNPNSTLTKPKTSKKLLPFKSSAQISSNSNSTNNTYSLNRKNLEKNNNILKAAATLNFTDSNIIPCINNKKSFIDENKTLRNNNNSSTKQNSFFLFDKTDSTSTKLDNSNNKMRSYSTQQSTSRQESNHYHKQDESTKLKDLSASSTSSIADMKNQIHDHQQQNQKQLLTNGQLNQRLQTIKRSFNKKASFKNKSKELDNDSQSVRNETDLMNASFESQQFPFEAFDLDSPNQTKKHNHLFLNNTSIDLNTHHHSRLKSGFLFFSSKKKIPPNDLLVFSNQSIQKPLIKTNDKIVKKESCELFKLIQIYMGDRKQTSSYDLSKHKLDNNDLKVNQRDLICLEIMTKGWIYSQLRDELYLQLVKQTTENPSQTSLLNGWELIAICLSFFPPSQKFFPFLTEYIYSHLFKLNTSFNWLEDLDRNQSNYSLQLIESAKKQQDQMGSADEKKDYLNQMANACLKRLERIHLTGAKKGLKKPTLDEILLSRRTITSPSLFGTTLSELMNVQKSKCPNLSLPWIQTTLSEAVLRLNGAKTEGIFRVPGDLDEVNNLKVKYDQLWCSKDVLLTEDNGSGEFVDLMANIQDPHLPASLLKLWYRELYEPLIPHELYDECIRNCDRPAECINVIQRLPQINKLVFTYLIRFLKVFAASENVAVTKMDANNLSMIMAPNCLRCKSNEPKIIMENTKKEMQFLNTLIHHLDTSCVQGII